MEPSQQKSLREQLRTWDIPRIHSYRDSLGREEETRHRLVQEELSARQQQEATNTSKRMNRWRVLGVIAAICFGALKVPWGEWWQWLHSQGETPPAASTPITSDQIVPPDEFVPALPSTKQAEPAQPVLPKAGEEPARPPGL